MGPKSIYAVSRLFQAVPPLLAHLRISEEALLSMKEDIDDAEGNEVLWWGEVDEERMVVRVNAAARGNEDSVPALFPHMEKGDVVIHNHPSGYLTPSGPDLSVASQIGNQGIGFYIVDNRLSRLYVVAEPVVKAFTGPLDENETAAFLEPGGPLEAHWEGYEPREPQIELMRYITRGFNENLVVSAEAGTGVGKSFAYLIPALLWARKNKERVVISTGTINLQQQLMEKDIPLVKKLIDVDIKAVLVKGRGNYVCLKRLNEAWNEDSLFRDDKDELELIRQWVQQSPDGSKTDLSFQPSRENWNKINSEADLCSGIRCPHYENCFVIRARKEASTAGILVVNHHLLFADLSVRLGGFGFESFAVLPPFQRVIFDEAHNMEKAATSFFSNSYSRLGLLRYIYRLYRNRRNKESGLLLKWEKRVGISEESSSIPGLLQDILKAADTLDTLAMDLNPFTGSMAVKGDLQENVRFGILEPMEKLQKLILQLSRYMSDLIKTLPEGSEDQDYVIEWNLLRNRFESVSSFMENYRHYQENHEEIFWLEKKGKEGKEYLNYFITPLDISPMMVEALYEPFPSVICTSATLSVNRSFQYWMDRTGVSLLHSERKLTGIFDSPFNYRDQVLLAIPQDVPFPTEKEAWSAYCLPLILEALLVSEGKALLLFTSYQVLLETYQYLKEPLEHQGISLYRQGEEDRNRLLTRFKDEVSSVLLATDSFWEGVDVPGDSLRLVVIGRLPFRVPSDPVLQARMEVLEKKGRNPFMEMSLPEAVMRFKQGFGRLMRAHSDGGIVLILDGRILRKRYGSTFLQSLPETQRVIKSKEGIIMDMENFLYGRSGS